MAEGNRLFYEKKYLEAIPYYERVLEIDHKRLSAWLNKGASLASLGKVEAATRCYDKVLDIVPEYIAAWTSKGNIVLELGKFYDAIACYDKALEIDPENTAILTSKFEALAKLDLQAEAKLILNQVQEINANRAKVLIENGVTQFNSGKIQRAMQHFLDAAGTSLEETGRWLQEWLDNEAVNQILNATNPKIREQIYAVLHIAKNLKNYPKTCLNIIRLASLSTEKRKKPNLEEIREAHLLETFKKEFVKNYLDDYSQKSFDQILGILLNAFNTNVDESSSNDLGKFWLRLKEINDNLAPIASLAGKLYSSENRSYEESMIMFHSYCYTYIVEFESLFFDVFKNLLVFSKTCKREFSMPQNAANEEILARALENNEIEAMRQSFEQLFHIEPVFLEPIHVQEEIDIRNAMAYGQANFDPLTMLIHLKCQQIDGQEKRIIYKTAAISLDDFVQKCSYLANFVDAFRYIAMIINVEKIIGNLV